MSPTLTTDKGDDCSGHRDHMTMPSSSPSSDREFSASDYDEEDDLFASNNKDRDTSKYGSMNDDKKPTGITPLFAHNVPRPAALASCLPFFSLRQVPPSRIARRAVSILLVIFLLVTVVTLTCFPGNNISSGWNNNYALASIGKGAVDISTSLLPQGREPESQAILLQESQSLVFELEEKFRSVLSALGQCEMDKAAEVNREKDTDDDDDEGCIDRKKISLLSMNQPCEQSSVYKNYLCSNAVDGLLETYSHTDITSNPTQWRVQLPGNSYVQEVTLVLAGDWAKSRYHGFSIRLLGDDKTREVARIDHPALLHTAVSKFRFFGVQAKYVEIRMDRAEYMHWSEVLVYGWSDELSLCVRDYDPPVVSS